MAGSDRTFRELTEAFVGMYAEGEAPPLPVGVKLVPIGAALPDGATAPEEHQGVPWCKAVRLACEEGEVVTVTEQNVGCPAAAIALGLVSQFSESALVGTREYTDLMEQAAAPADFTRGLVYACQGVGFPQFAIFRDADAGRYETLGAALKAVSGMKAIQPPIMAAAIAYRAEDLEDVAPDVVIAPLKPKHAMLAIEGYTFPTGKRVTLNTIGVRAVCSDLTAIPFLDQELNGSLFCVGARALGGWGGSLMALGMPLSVFRQVVAGMEKSATGYPYAAFPE